MEGWVWYPRRQGKKVVALNSFTRHLPNFRMNSSGSGAVGWKYFNSRAAATAMTFNNVLTEKLRRN
jgi:hypothetical protein